MDCPHMKKPSVAIVRGRDGKETEMRVASCALLDELSGGHDGIAIEMCATCTRSRISGRVFDMAKSSVTRRLIRESTAMRERNERKDLPPLAEEDAKKAEASIEDAFVKLQSLAGAEQAANALETAARNGLPLDVAKRLAMKHLPKS